MFEGRLGVQFWILSIWYPHGDTEQPVRYMSPEGSRKLWGERYHTEVIGIEMGFKNHLKMGGDGKRGRIPRLSPLS